LNAAQTACTNTDTTNLVIYVKPNAAGTNIVVNRLTSNSLSSAVLTTITVSVVATSSVNVFHSLQEGHLPAHFVDSYPQLLQKKAVFDLPIK